MSRILKSNYVVLEEKKLSIDNTVFVPSSNVSSDFVDEYEFNFDDTPAAEFERDIIMEEGEMPEDELAAKILERAKNEANRIIQAANDDAELILDKMEMQAQEAIEEITRMSKQNGYNEGYAQGAAETESIKEDARLLYTNAVREREEKLSGLEGEIVDLISDILDKLLTDLIEISPELILYLVRKGLSDSKLSGDVTIHVSDEDYEAIFENREMLSQLADAGSKIEILRDYSLKKSDCIMETPFGAIDCSLDQQYTALRKNLYFIFENR